MAGDDLEVFDIFAEYLSRAVGDIHVAGAVEAVAAHAVFLVIFIIDAVDESLRRHGLMEGGVENHDIRELRQHGLDRENALQIGRVVQRREGHDFLDAFDNFRSHQHGLGELLAAVNDAVSGCRELVEALEDPVLGIHQHIQHILDSLCMCREINFAHHCIHAGLRMLDARAADADTLHQPLGQHGFAVHIDQLILEGRTAAVENKNFHKKRIASSC